MKLFLLVEVLGVLVGRYWRVDWFDLKLFGIVFSCEVEERELLGEVVLELWCNFWVIFEVVVILDLLGCGVFNVELCNIFEDVWRWRVMGWELLMMDMVIKIVRVVGVIWMCLKSFFL